MIYYDDMFHKEYKNTNKQLFLVDKNDVEYPVTLHEDTTDTFYRLVDDADAAFIPYYSVVWRKTEITKDAKYCVGEPFVEAAKEQALKLDIATELKDHIVSIQCYFDYYQNIHQQLAVYAISNYDVRQDSKSSIIVKFIPRGDRMADSIDHKILGIAPNRETKGRVVSTSVEAWRYQKLDWKEIRELCPEFVTGVLRGNQP